MPGQFNEVTGSEATLWSPEGIDQIAMALGEMPKFADKYLKSVLWVVILGYTRQLYSATRVVVGNNTGGVRYGLRA
jgi:hypothetical protein